MELLFESEFCKLGYHKEYNLVFLKWKDFTTISFEEFKKPYLFFIDFQDKVKIKNFIADARKQGIILPEYRNWFQNELLPQAIAKGLNKGAFVSEASIFKRYYINHILNSAKKFGFKLKSFVEIDKAVAWIKSEN